MKHTPGPWHYIGEEDGDFCVFAGDDFIINIGDSPIIEILNRPNMDLVAFDTTQANARLIAAAPDLLEACKEMVSFMKKYDAGFAYAGHATTKAMRHMESAIAKAEAPDAGGGGKA